MTPSVEWAVRVRGVGKTFHARTPALRNVKFDVRAGERVALLGASGSGKSTLLRCLCALETIDPGDAAVEIFGRTLQRDGHVAGQARSIRRDVGIVFQQFNLVGRLPVLTNVLTGLVAELPLWRSMSGRFSQAERMRALQALDAIGLAPQAMQRASTLSGGQQQRAAIARVLVQGARLLLADEPVASLDPESTRRVMELLADLNRRHGMTLLVSLHQVSLARRYCDRVIALRDGLLVFDGPTDALTTPFLRQLYGTSADELLDEHADRQSDERGSEPPAGSVLPLAA
jgi:phosphonate transport system ATP-binding protein